MILSGRHRQKAPISETQSNWSTAFSKGHVLKDWAANPRPLDRLRDVDEGHAFPTMLILRGSPALSQFRLQKRVQDLVAAVVPVRRGSAEFVHLAELSGELTTPQRDVLEKLLTYGPSRAAERV